MKIKKMVLLASMAMAAIAFAMPAAAQAQTHGLTEGGELLEPGAAVTATSTNLVTTVGANRLECKKVTLHYVVKTNGPTHVVLDPALEKGAKHNGTTESCVTVTPIGSFTNHITNAGTGSLTINTWGHGTASSTFTSLTTFVNRHCSFSGTVTLQALKPGGSEVEVPGSVLKAPEENCNEGTIHGTLSLETPNGTPVTTDFVATG